ncbi:NAD(P)H nitroreductase [Antrihabitans sp. YC2-6]|uniref:Acg family FMN-binding oxidoreductase n=1 Tax=Antrihabitans sp. YC2-6 TaxID=2799498 RepID=UPI0018F31487|nr:NAD(P)H nitroreductase [Antrihabitans sp. YC2-6]MBJ8346976.1 NAD(P)H nitroreductase [Antrihabitans sp. YC2-6]
MNTLSVPDTRTVESVIALACRAPSLHNSQPWRWVRDGHSLDLYCDPDRLLPSTDAFGRQMVISCGAALDHLQTAFAARNWQTDITRMPDNDRDHLAQIIVAPAHHASAEATDAAAAIVERRSDRLPLAAPTDLDALTLRLGALALVSHVRVDVLGRSAHAELVHASALTSSQRQLDAMYQDELYWWTGESTLPEGVPKSALISAAEHDRVAMGRRFPVGKPRSRRHEIVEDRAAILVLSTAADNRIDWLRTGEALSKVLLECTARGLATCALTHVTELPHSRNMIRSVSPTDGIPQVLVRVGIAPTAEDGPPTPRRPLSEVLFTKK